MTVGAERRVILVTRQTRLQELVARYNTLAQARFYLEHLGADFGDYLQEDEAYSRSLRVTVVALQRWAQQHGIANENPGAREFWRVGARKRPPSTEFGGTPRPKVLPGRRS